jgi:hypothetical protein
MAIVRKGTLTVTTGGAAQNLALGFTPSYFRMENKTKITANTNGVQIVEWYDDMPNASAYLWTTTAGAPVLSYTASNGVTPYVTSDASLFPSSNLTITGISKASNAVITANNSFTTADYGVTKVTFHNVVGMTQINTLTGTVVSASGGTSFTVNINTTGFTTYGSGGIANIITGIPALQGGLITSGNAPGFPPAQTNTSQVLNAPLYNAGTIGITLGSALMVTTSDVWQYMAYLDADFTSA